MWIMQKCMNFRKAQMKLHHNLIINGGKANRTETFKWDCIYELAISWNKYKFFDLHSQLILFFY